MIKSNYVVTGALVTAIILPGVVLGGNETVKVKSGDTLSEIAANYGMSVTSLKQLNNLKSNTIYINQILKVSGAAEVSSASKGTIGNATYVNIRSGAGVSHKAITALKKGTPVTIHSEKYGWSLVTAGNVKGYVTSSYIIKGKASANAPITASKTGVVVGASSLNVRGGAGMGYKPVAVLKKGTQVTINGTTNGWHSITAGKVKGYVASGYISQGSATTTNKVAAKAPVQAVAQKETGLVRPTATTRVTSKFGSRWGSFHYGVDFALAGNQKIMASASGTVTRSFSHPSLGEVIFIKHSINGQTIETVYAHLRSGSRAVSVGTKVKAGQFIGWMGSTGNSTGQHLHFEVHPGGYKGNSSAVDPLKYVK